MSGQAISCHDRVRKLGTGPDLCALGRPTLAVGMRARDKAARVHSKVSSPCVATRVFSVTTQGQKVLCHDRETSIATGSTDKRYIRVLSR